MLMDIVWALCGIVGWEIGKWIASKIRTPYRWKCKQCGFKVATNVRDSYEISVSSHVHNREYK